MMRFLDWFRAAFGIGEERAAWAAIRRCWCVPYLREISSLEHHGLLRLERDGMVERDEGLGGETHWHLTERGRGEMDRLEVAREGARQTPSRGRTV